MQIKLPKLGEGAESGTVVGILVQQGDRVQKGQTLLELESEKAVAPIPASASGVVSEIRVKEGDQISVGQVIMVLEVGDSDASSAQATQPSTERDQVEVGEEPGETAESQVAPDAGARAGEGFAPPGGASPAASPSVRKWARQLGIDLGRVQGSERGGRIVPADLKAYIQRLQELVFVKKQAQAESSAAPIRSKPVSIDFSKWGPVKKTPLTPLRQTISRRMAENWNAIPHVTQFDAADITAVMALRKKHAAAYEGQGTKLTLTPFVLKAVAATLRKHPRFNSSLDEAAGEIVEKEYIHIGLAVDTEQGLLVPVLRDVDKKSVLELSREVNEMALKARDRKVALEEMQGGTFTISNQGGIGGAHFTPIINRPEVAILGLGRAAQQAVVIGGKIEPRLMMPLTLSYDHRLIDGGSAARFTVDLLEALQSFPEADVALPASS